LPVLPIKNAVLFPHLMMPLSVGRPASLAAIQAAQKGADRTILVVAQKDPSVDVPTQQHLYGYGTEAVIKQVLQQPGGALGLVVLGKERVQILAVQEKENYLQ